MGLILGLTGGIATGKSTASQLFAQANYPIVDADVIAKEVVSPNQPALNSLVTIFGSEIVTKENTLDRKKLAKIIFFDEEKRIELNQCLAPYIQSAILSQIGALKNQSELLIVDIPLLYEAGYEKYVDKVAVVYVSENTQLLRLMQRDHLSEKEAIQRIKSQLSIEEKKKKADIVFDNQGSKEELEKQITQWLRKIKL